MVRQHDQCPIPRIEPYRQPVNGVVQPPIKPPPSRPGRNTNQLDFLYKKIDVIIRHPDAFMFRDPVDTMKLKVPTYYDVIVSPMDLNTVKQRLFNKYYWSAQEAIDDCELIFSNCFIFNQADSQVANMGRSLKYFFLAQLDGMPEQEFEIMDYPIGLRDKQIKRKSSADDKKQMWSQYTLQSVSSINKHLKKNKKMRNELPPLVETASGGTHANTKRNKAPKAAAIKGPPKKRGRPRKIVVPALDGTMPNAAPGMSTFNNYANRHYAPAAAAAAVDTSKNHVHMTNKMQQTAKFTMAQTNAILQCTVEPAKLPNASTQSNPGAKSAVMTFNQKLTLVKDWQCLTTDQMYDVNDIVKRMEKNLAMCEEVDVDDLKPATLWAICKYVAKCKSAQM